jgi:hypothetical protein
VPRSLRHIAATALATAVVTLCAVPALAADQPVLAGTVVDANGDPFPVENGLLEMTAPDGGGIHAAQVSVGGDGSFEVEVMPWGTDDNPAEVTITITGVVASTVETAAGCTDQLAPVAESTFAVALANGGQPEPVELVAEERLIGSLCGEGSSSEATLPPSEVDPASPVPSEPPAIVEPETPAPSEAPVAIPAEPTSDGGVSPALLGAVAVGAVVLVALGAWFGLRRSRA